MLKFQPTQIFLATIVSQIAAIAAMCVQPEAEYRPLMADVVPSLIPLVKNSCYAGSSGSSRFQNQVESPRH